LWITCGIASLFLIEILIGGKAQEIYNRGAWGSADAFMGNSWFFNGDTSLAERHLLCQKGPFFETD
jgi:hypothetical protein